MQSFLCLHHFVQNHEASECIDFPSFFKGLVHITAQKPLNKSGIQQNSVFMVVDCIQIIQKMSWKKETGNAGLGGLHQGRQLGGYSS